MGGVHERRKTRSVSCSGKEKKGENAFGGLGSSLGVIPGRFHSKGGTAAKSSQLRRSNSRLASENVFHLFRSSLVKIPNASAGFPLFPQPAFPVPLYFFCGILRVDFTQANLCTAEDDRIALFPLLKTHCWRLI